MSYYFVKQHDQSDCGAACLSMILGNLGCKLSLSQIRQKVKTDINGTTVYGIVKTAKSYGLSSEALCGTFKEFCDELNQNKLTFPMIVNVISPEGFSHFIIINKYKNRKLYIADPASRCYKKPLEALEEIWIGNIICFSDLDKVEKRNETKHKMDKYIKICLKHKKFIFAAVFISLLIAFVNMIGTLIFEYVVDGIYQNNFGSEKYVIQTDDVSDSLDMCILSVVTSLFPTFRKLCTAVIILFVFQNAIAYLQSYLLAVMSKKINIPVMMSFFEHVVNVPIEFYSGRRTGDVLSRFNDASGICQSISNIILGVLINCTLMFFYGIFLFGISPQLFCIVLMSCVMYFLIVCIFKEKLKNNLMDILAQKSDVNSNLKENVEGIKTIKVYRLENNVANKFLKSFHKLVQKSFHNTMLESLQSILVTLLSSVSVIVVLWIGVALCLNGVIQVGALITFYVMMGSFISPVQSLIALQPEFQSVIVSAERLNDVFDIERENVLTGDSKEIEKIKTLEIRNMTFSYGYALPVLKDTSFQIKQGERIAVLGKNGCGKTTLANILMGLYQVDDAEFLINNEVVSANIYKNFAAKIAYIPQESFFFSDNIYENLICGNENISEQEIMEVLDMCCLIDFVKELPQGIYTRLEEGATNLSAGTKQKLAIARAILNKPEIIILDESTSNIDLETEKEIIQLFHDLGDTVSIIDISHRIRDYSKYDNVYYLAENKLSLKAERRKDHLAVAQ